MTAVIALPCRREISHAVWRPGAGTGRDPKDPEGEAGPRQGSARGSGGRLAKIESG